MAFFDAPYVPGLGAADDELIACAMPLTDIAETIALITPGIFPDKFQLAKDIAPGVERSQVCLDSACLSPLKVELDNAFLLIHIIDAYWC